MFHDETIASGAFLVLVFAMLAYALFNTKKVAQFLHDVMWSDKPVFRAIKAIGIASVILRVILDWHKIFPNNH